MVKIIGVISIKGGVGKTSIVSSLGALLAKDHNKKVLMVDANFSAPNLALHFGLADPDYTIHQVLSNQIDIRDSIYQTKIGLDILPGSNLRYKIDPISLKSHLELIKDEYDFILIDSSPSLDEEVLSTIIASDVLFVISSPDHVTLSATMNAVRIAKLQGAKIKGVILNKVYNKKFELDLNLIEEISDCKVISILPHDYRVLEALSNYEQVHSLKNKDISIEYKKLAAAICGEKYKDNRIKTKIKNLLNLRLEIKSKNKGDFGKIDLE